MKKNPFHWSNVVLLFIAALASIFVVVRPGLAQSDKQANNDNLIALAKNGNAASGKAVFHSVGCTDCHGDDASGSDGPSLIGIKKTFPDFVHWIRNASGGMYPFPPNQISDEELADVYAFIEGPSNPYLSKPVPKVQHPAAAAPVGNAERGEEAYRSVGCADCHGEHAEGMDGPRLLNIKKSLPDFIHWVRNASNGMDPFSPAVVSDAQLIDIYAFIGGSGKPNDSMAAPAAEPAPHGDPESGALFFNKVGCADCHGEKAQGSEGPALVNIQRTFPEFKDLVRNPRGAMPNEFPPELVSDAQLVDIYAFLQPHPASVSPVKTVVPIVSSVPKADAENGKKLFMSEGCVKCHVADRQAGEADAQVNGLPVSLSSMIDFVRHPSGKMPPYADAAISDQQIADIYAFMKSRPKS